MKKYQFVDNLKYIGAIFIVIYHATGILGLPIIGEYSILNSKIWKVTG